jgi:hypothetical protein
MTVETLQSELARLDAEDRRRIIDYLQQLDESRSDDLRLGESVADYKAGRTVPADDAHLQLRQRVSGQ